MDKNDKINYDINNISKKVKQISIKDNYENIKWLTGC